MILSMKDKTINWEQLQENYMKECVTKVGQFNVVVLPPDKLFEWFKAEVEEYTK